MSSAVLPPTPECPLDRVFVRPFGPRSYYAFVAGCTYEMPPLPDVGPCQGAWPRIRLTSAYGPTRHTPLFSASDAPRAFDRGNGEFDVAFPAGVVVSVCAQRFRYPGPVTLRVRMDTLRRGIPVRASH